MAWQDANSLPSGGVNANANYYYEIGRFNELADQPGGAADARINVKFGPAKDDDIGVVSVRADGVFEVKKTGPISIKQRIRATRPANQGSAEVYFQAQASVDNGANWFQLGDTQHESIDEGGDTDIFLDVSFFEATAGVLLRATWAQSSTGIADANLVTATPSAAMLADGFTPVSSAETVVYGVKNFNYV